MNFLAKGHVSRSASRFSLVLVWSLQYNWTFDRHLSCLSAKAFVTVRKEWSCLYAGVWKHWHVMCQPTACQQLPSFASGDRQFTVHPIMHSFFPAVAFWGWPDQRWLHNCRCSWATSTIITSNAFMEFESKLTLLNYTSCYIELLFSFWRILLLSLFFMQSVWLYCILRWPSSAKHNKIAACFLWCFGCVAACFLCTAACFHCFAACFHCDLFLSCCSLLLFCCNLFLLCCSLCMLCCNLFCNVLWLVSIALAACFHCDLFLLWCKPTTLG